MAARRRRDDGGVEGGALGVEGGVHEERVGRSLRRGVEDGSVLGVLDDSSDDGDPKRVAGDVGSEGSLEGAVLVDLDLSGVLVEGEVDVVVGGVGVAVGQAEHPVGGGLGGGELDVAVAGGDLAGGDGTGVAPGGGGGLGEGVAGGRDAHRRGPYHRDARRRCGGAEEDGAVERGALAEEGRVDEKRIDRRLGRGVEDGSVPGVLHDSSGRRRPEGSRRRRRFRRFP